MSNRPFEKLSHRFFVMTFDSYEVIYVVVCSFEI